MISLIKVRLFPYSFVLVSSVTILYSPKLSPPKRLWIVAMQLTRLPIQSLCRTPLSMVVYLLILGKNNSLVSPFSEEVTSC